MHALPARSRPLPDLPPGDAPDEAPPTARGWSAPDPHWSEPAYSPVKIDTVARVVAEAGVPTAVLLQGTGIDGGRLQDADYKTSTAQLYALLRRAAALCPAAARPGLGLRMGAQLRITSYGMYGYALLSAPTMREALERALRFHALANPLVPLRAETDEDSVTWCLPNRHELLLPELDEPVYRLLIELQMATHQTLARDVMGDWCRPCHLALPWAAPADARELAAWQRCFGGAPRFGGGRAELSYPASWLARPPQLANAITAAQTSRECARLVESLEANGAGAASMARRVYRELVRTPGRFPGIESIAETLCMTSRTLRRHLQAEHTSYADLLARVRRALAEDYLRGTRMSIDDIAAALDFSDARSFRHAFARWTGSSPSDWRRGSEAAPAAAAAAAAAAKPHDRIVSV